MDSSSSVTEADTNYLAVCKLAVQNAKVFETFRSHRDYNVVLEHVTEQEGQAYWNEIQKDPSTNLSKHLDEFQINDTVGGPRIFQYSFGTFSPTTLRYMKVLHDLVKIWGDLKDWVIVEIGGGYGGQCRIVKSMFRVNYNIIDLDVVCDLQAKYLTHTKCPAWITLTPFSKPDLLPHATTVDLVISNYAFSECNASVRQKYIELVLSQSKHGYLTINYFNAEERDTFINEMRTYGKQITILPELPQTGPDNCIMIW
jgi:putative sugar O-methyltransferase